MADRGNLFTEPAGYFLTLSAYGNRLHGDERGTVDLTTNEYGQPPLGPDHRRVYRESGAMRWPPMRFDEHIRRVIEQAFGEVCRVRGWTLHACHCRTNHVHMVLSGDATTARMLHDLKSIATRRLREAKLVEPRRAIWAEHGSTIYLWNEREVMAASDYTVNYQGTDLPGSLGFGPWLNEMRKSEDPL